VIVYRRGNSTGRADALTRRLGDLPEGSDEKLQNMEQVDLKPHILPEQLRISANEIPEQQPSRISDLCTQAYMDNLLPSKIVEAIKQGGSLKEISVAECTEQEGQV
jgi:hypothetical protein